MGPDMGLLIAALALMALGLGLLIHHGLKHLGEPDDAPAKREGRPECCFFQLHDIANHETWILVCWTNALTLLLLRGL